MSVFPIVAIAIFLDRLLGEPTVYHPLKGFINFAVYVANFGRQQASTLAKQGTAANEMSGTILKIQGIFAILVLVLPLLILTAFISQLPLINFIFNCLLLYLTISAHHLKHHALEVQKALSGNNIELARHKINLITTTDSKTMGEKDILLSCLESVLAKGNDAILAPVFWFFLFGASGALAYRLINTLDIVWNDQNAPDKNFGFAAAKVNYFLTWIPARLTALSYMLLGDIKSGWQRWRAQAIKWNSDNTVQLIAAGTGALNIQIGPTAPALSKLPQLPDITRACDLLDRSMVLWLAIILILSLGH